MFPHAKSTFLYLLIAGFTVTPSARAQDKIDLDALLARHALSLKKTEAPPLRSRIIAGTVQMTVLVGGTGTLNGNFDLESEGPKRRLGMQFGHTSYDHEKLVTDGSKIWVDMVNTVRRSDLGQFLYAQDQLFKEGLFGGVLSTAWPLAQGAEIAQRMKYEGLKKVDGRQLHVVRYRTEKKSGDVEITLYFDANTYSHVRTVYTITLRPSIASTPGATETTQSPPAGPPRTEVGETMGARQQVSRVRLEENFDDFHNADGYAIPAKWSVKLSTEAQQSRIWEWQMILSRVTNNPAVDAKLFEVK